MAGPPLPAEVLARRSTLPRRPDPVTLRAGSVLLLPLDLDHDVDALHAASSGAPVVAGGRCVGAYDAGERIWRHMSAGPFGTAAELRAWLAPQVAADDALPLVVRVAGDPVGVACFMATRPEHLAVELGAIWYSPVAQGTGTSATATLLMLDHAFRLGFRRVEWKCDADNQASRRAALAYGFTHEGIQQSHMIVKGRSRDTAWYRILADEWPDVRPRLSAYAADRRAHAGGRRAAPA